MSEHEIPWPISTWTFDCNECTYHIESSRDELAIDTHSYFIELLKALMRSHSKKYGHFDYDIGVDTVEPVKTIDATITVNGDSDD